MREQTKKHGWFWPIMKMIFRIFVTPRSQEASGLFFTQSFNSSSHTRRERIRVQPPFFHKSFKKQTSTAKTDSAFFPQLSLPNIESISPCATKNCLHILLLLLDEWIWKKENVSFFCCSSRKKMFVMSSRWMDDGQAAQHLTFCARSTNSHFFTILTQRSTNKIVHNVQLSFSLSSCVCPFANTVWHSLITDYTHAHERRQ